MAVTPRLTWTHAVLVVIVVVGLAARVHGIHDSFDGDEIVSVTIASGRFVEVLSHSLLDRPHPPLHNVLLHFWLTAFGVSEMSARTLSVAFSGVFLIVSYLLLRRLVAGWIALGLVAALALSPLFVYYGQQARPYALIACLSSLNFLAFTRVLDVPHDRRRIVIWATSCFVLLYAQYMAILPIAIELLLAVIYLRPSHVRILRYGSVASALISPWLIAAMGRSLLEGADPLSHIAWMELPSPTGFVWFYVSVFGEGLGRARWLLLLFALLGVAYLRHRVALGRLPASHLLLLLIGVGMPTIIYMMSVWGPKPIFAGRQLLGAAVAFIVTLALWLATLPRVLAVALILFLLTWTSTALIHAFDYSSKPPWRDMAAHIDRRYGATVVVAQESWVGIPLAYYRESGLVRLWSERPNSGDDDRFLFVCRPTRSGCSSVEITALDSRRTLAATRRWGIERAEQNQLRLYEVKSRSEPSFETPRAVPGR